MVFNISVKMLCFDNMSLLLTVLHNFLVNSRQAFFLVKGQGKMLLHIYKMVLVFPVYCKMANNRHNLVFPVCRKMANNRNNLLKGVAAVQ